MEKNACHRMTVSVIIPAYNRANFIQDAVNSALRQSHLPDEIIVVDDGSTDDTQRILAQFGPPVRVVRQEHRGRSAARNAGLREAIGATVMFLDSDDLLMPRSIERCVQVLERRPEVGVVYTDAYLIDRHQKQLAVYSQVMPGRRPSGMVLDELARRCFLMVSSMIRRSCLGTMTFEEGVNFCEDYDLWRRLAAVCQFQWLDEPLLCYRQHDGMTVGTRPLEALDRELTVQRRIMAMPEFRQLAASVRARVYWFHGKKNARRWALFAVSLLGPRAFRFVVAQRRRLIGSVLGTKSCAEALPRERAAARLGAPLRAAFGRPSGASTEDASHG
jgi:glycosyltransferase involved in cell wall biosynthesis